MNIIDVGLSMNESSMQYRNTSSINALVVHHIEAEGSNWTVEFINNMHKRDNGWSGIGYHIYIRKDGSVYRGRKDCYVGAHCQGFNSTSIGIAFEGNYDKSTASMPDAQYKAWVEVYNYYKSIYGTLPVYGHKEKSSSECPGAYFPLTKVKAVVNGNVSVNTTAFKWVQDNNGWYYSDGTNIKKSCWEKIDGKWYRFNDSGYCLMNTWYRNQYGEWFYLTESGAMVESDWVKSDNKWYYMNTDGVMTVSKWIKDKDCWYYLGADGSMRTGWLEDGNWYYLDTDGKMKTNYWIKSDNEWYYVGNNGAMVKGFQTIDNVEYYFYENGIMAHDVTIVDKTFGSDGKRIAK